MAHVSRRAPSSRCAGTQQPLLKELKSVSRLLCNKVAVGTVFLVVSKRTHIWYLLTARHCLGPQPGEVTAFGSCVLK